MSSKHTNPKSTLNDIATTLNQIQNTLKDSVTKKDLQDFATKKDLQNFATKEDLAQLEKRLETKFATKTDLQNMEKRLTRKFRTTDNLIIKHFDRGYLNLRKRVSHIESKLNIPKPASDF